MAEESNIYVISIVALVAIVGLVTLFMPGGDLEGVSSGDFVMDEDGNIAGQAFYGGYYNRRFGRFKPEVEIPKKELLPASPPLRILCSDADGDGFQGRLPAGCKLTTSFDCNDADANIMPAPYGMDICDDGIDQDCSGSDRTCPTCTDTDAPFGPSVAGSATGVPYGISEDDVEPSTFSDLCSSDTSVKEWSCVPGYLGGSVVDSTIRACPAGMKCFDSDGPTGNSPAYCR